jgi:hypothetical protein
LQPTELAAFIPSDATTNIVSTQHIKPMLLSVDSEAPAAVAARKRAGQTHRRRPSIQLEGIQPHVLCSGGDWYLGEQPEVRPPGQFG